MPVPQLPQVYIDTTFNPPTGVTWPAHTSADFRNALLSANPGDTIVLDAGATYVGNFTLSVKSNPNRQWIYIVSSALSSLPASGTRVNPTTDAVNMPKLVTPNAMPVITAPPGASYYRLVGLEITSASTQGCRPTNVPPTNCFSYNLIFLDGGKLGDTLPDSITVDRSYLHGSPTQDVRQGIIADATNVAVVDSHISDIHESGADSQAFLAYWTPGPIKVVDNFLSATTEDAMFGGSGGANNPYVPSDIEFRNNHLFKPLEWAQVGITIPPKNQWVAKDNLEFKSGRRVLVDSNLFENSWKSGQQGYSVDLTVRTGQSGNLAVNDDITFTNNVIMNAASGFSTLYDDYDCGPGTPYPNCTNKGETKRIKIYNNLILFRDPTLVGGTNNFGLQVSPKMTDLVFQHNTMVPAPGTDCYQAIYFELMPKSSWPPPQPATNNVWVLDNVLCRQPTGDWGGQGMIGLTYYMGNPSPLDPRYLGNLMYVPGDDTVQQFPANDSTKAPFIFNSDYQLLVPNWTDTSDGKVAGIDGASLQPVLTSQ
jgi:hypothetical protein